jgi:hypothetical protein
MDEFPGNIKGIHDGILAWTKDSLGVDLGAEPFATNDWILIIKLHAMIETGLNAALVSRFGTPELSRVVAKLDTSNPATGKVAFAKALKILPKHSVTFIQKLSELRNLCVHDTRNSIGRRQTRRKGA